NAVANKTWKAQFDTFNSSNLSGKISDIHASRGAVRFQLNGSAETYWFIPRMTANNDFASFGSTAKTGDSVFKPASADTVILIKVLTKKVYKFTFLPPG
ncbi:MAG TPA: hypothetical protein VKR41_12405, partial [Puia sp.]|nr:hypothetical protein [Puia sp.]